MYIYDARVRAVNSYIRSSHNTIREVGRKGFPVRYRYVSFAYLLAKSDLCRLVCGRGSIVVVRASTVVDGTPCGFNGLGRCVQGQCLVSAAEILIQDAVMTKGVCFIGGRLRQRDRVEQNDGSVRRVRRE